MKQKGLFLETFGCQMNVVDSERIVALMKDLGYAQVDAPEKADLILLNTCTVRDKAERKVYGHLGHFKPLKEANPNLVIGVGGCVAQQEGEKLLQTLKHVDLVFGTHNIHKLPEMVQAATGEKIRSSEVEFLDRDTRLQLFPERTDEGGPTRFVTIMQGCDNFCSYCIVPHVRGREVSRPSREIVEEVRALIDQGVKEITLLGQNVNSYGIKESGEISFADLLRQVNAVEGLERLRFTTSHPKDMSDDLVACFGELDKLCPQLQLPLQSGSNRILEAMNRGYTRERYLEQVRKLKELQPDIRFTTDVIVGFPGETEEDFEQTMEVLEEVRYSDIYSFLYSPRKGTAAYDLTDDTPKDIRQARFDRMMDLQRRTSTEIWAQDLKTVVPVLVEGKARLGNGQVFGRTVWNRIVNFEGGLNLVGQVVPVRILENTTNSQVGVLDDLSETATMESKPANGAKEAS